MSSSDEDEGEDLTEEQMGLIDDPLRYQNEDGSYDYEDDDMSQHRAGGKVAEAYEHTTKSKLIKTMDWGLIIVSAGILVAVLIFIFIRIFTMLQKAYF
jgi:hypothetical protein